MDLDRMFGAVREGFEDALGEDALGLYVVPDEMAFLAVTRTRPSPPVETSLRELHRGLDEVILQGSYAPVEDLNSPMSVGRTWLRLSTGSRELLPSAADNTAHHRWRMRHSSSTLLGPPPSAVIHDIDAQGLRAEAIGLARFRAEEIEDHPGLLEDAAGVARLVADLSSVLHTAVEGSVLTGPPALRWALDQVPERERSVLAGVVAGRTPDPGAARSFAWEVHRLVGTAALRLRDS